MSDERILVDTSVWIDYFRNTNPELTAKLDLFLDQDLVSVPKIVMAELLQGAREKKEIKTILDYGCET